MADLAEVSMRVLIAFKNIGDIPSAFLHIVGDTLQLSFCFFKEIHSEIQCDMIYFAYSQAEVAQHELSCRVPLRGWTKPRHITCSYALQPHSSHRSRSSLTPTLIWRNILIKDGVSVSGVLDTGLVVRSNLVYCNCCIPEAYVCKKQRLQAELDPKSGRIKFHRTELRQTSLFFQWATVFQVLCTEIHTSFSSDEHLTTHPIVYQHVSRRQL